MLIDRLLDRLSSLSGKYRGTIKIPPKGPVCPVCSEAPKDWHVVSTCGHAACVDCLQARVSSLVYYPRNHGPLKCHVCPFLCCKATMPFRKLWQPTPKLCSCEIFDLVTKSCEACHDTVLVPSVALQTRVEQMTPGTVVSWMVPRNTTVVRKCTLLWSVEASQQSCLGVWATTRNGRASR
jgi:Zinc finger, C3HC4 type (RING finger)